MNEKLAQIQQSVTIRVADMIREIEGRGKSVVKLQTGDPDFSTPDVIVQAAFDAIKEGQTHYVNSRGLPELREAIADKLRQENGLDYDPKREILVTHGGIHGVFATLNAVIEAGDEVLIVDPCWMPYVSSTIIAGGKPVRIATDPRSDFRVTINQIESHITSHTKVLIINTPCNPTGNVLTSDELGKIAALAEYHDLYVIADEVYEKLVYDGCEHVSIASLPGMRERTITVNSFSKTYAMTGWRVGYLAARREIVDQILKISQYSITNIAPFIQKAAVIALTDPEVQRFVETMRDIYDKRRKLAIKRLEAIEGVSTIDPQGAFYLMIDISRFCLNSTKFSSRFLEKELVGVVPGVGFGQCAEGFLRITFAAAQEQIMEGIARLEQMLKVGAVQ